MHVEVNEANIDLYKLVELTGNSREMMLSRAAEAKESGHILSVEVPDDQVLEQNVFDVYQEEHVDPRRLEEGCHYELGGIDGIPVCIIHGQPSKYDVTQRPEAPCLAMEPLTVPTPDNFSGKSCAYSKITDAIHGTTYICLVHGKTSKYDIAHNPGLPCLAVEPE